MVSKYDVHAIPVVDDNEKLLGIVTVDDVIDILIEEQTRTSCSAPGGSRGHRGGGRAGLLRLQTLAERPPPVQLAASPVRHGDVDRTPSSATTKTRSPRSSPSPSSYPLLIGTGGNSGSLDRHDDRPRPRGRRDPPARLRAGSPARGRKRPRPRHPSRHRGLRAGAALGVDDAPRAHGRRLHPGDLRVGQRRRSHDSDARDDVQDRPDRDVGALIATLVDATGLIIYFTIAKSFLGL